MGDAFQIPFMGFFLLKPYPGTKTSMVEEVEYFQFSLWDFPY